MDNLSLKTIFSILLGIILIHYAFSFCNDVNIINI